MASTTRNRRDCEETENIKARASLTSKIQPSSVTHTMPKSHGLLETGSHQPEGEGRNAADEATPQQANRVVRQSSDGRVLLEISLCDANRNACAQAPVTRTPQAEEATKKIRAAQRFTKSGRARNAGRAAETPVVPRQHAASPLRQCFSRSRGDTSPPVPLWPDGTVIEERDAAEHEKRPKAWFVKIATPPPPAPEVPMCEVPSRLANLRKSRPAGKTTAHAASRRHRAGTSPSSRSPVLRTATAQVTPRRRTQRDPSASAGMGSPTVRLTARTRQVVEMFREFTPHLLTSEVVGSFLEQQGVAASDLTRLQRVQEAEKILAAAGVI